MKMKAENRLSVVLLGRAGGWCVGVGGDDELVVAVSHLGGSHLQADMWSYRGKKGLKIYLGQGESAGHR